MSRWRRFYGSSPLHLLALGASLAICGAAVVRWFDAGSDTLNILVWFAGALLGHDLVLVPLYTALDRLGRRTAGRAERAERTPRAGVTYVRAPALLAGLLGLVFFPLMVGLGDSTYHAASARHAHGYLWRWLAISGALFALSGLAWALRARRGRP